MFFAEYFPWNTSVDATPLPSSERRAEYLSLCLLKNTNRKVRFELLLILKKVMFSIIAEQFLGNCIMDFKKIDFIKLKEKLMGNKLRKKKRRVKGWQFL